jgi:hypothetical protein
MNNNGAQEASQPGKFCYNLVTWLCSAGRHNEGQESGPRAVGWVVSHPCSSGALSYSEHHSSTNLL